MANTVYKEKFKTTINYYNEEDYHDAVDVLRKVYGQKMNSNDKEHAYNSIKNIVDNIVLRYKAICEEKNKDERGFKIFKMIIQNTFGIFCPITESQIKTYYRDIINNPGYKSETSMINQNPHNENHNF
jgi:hypothetical protein